MAFPCWLFAFLPVFLGLLVVAIWQRPPNTPRGRVFYFLTGLSSIGWGAAFLLWAIAFSSEHDRARENSWIDYEELLGHYLPCILLGALGLLIGAGFCLKALFGRACVHRQ